MNILSILATDESRNMKETTTIPFFGTISFPLDKHVHYKKNLLVIGNASNMLKSIYVNNNIVYIDDQKRFSIPIDLDPGKNLIKTSFETLNNKVLNFTTRVLHLVSYPDMNSKVKGRREIEFLSTLGVLVGDDDGNFYPEKEVTRQFITKLMVLAMDENVEEMVSFDLFNDVPSTHPYAPYIQAAINSGLMFAFPDGTFKPDQPLTLSEAIYLLSNGGIINFSEIEEDNTYVTRAELAEFLAYTPKFERRIERLINWESGYNLQ